MALSQESQCLFSLEPTGPAEWVHTGATFVVALGTTFSAFWIIALNSWMHTPVGFEMRDGVAHATNWLQVVFNPSMPYRFFHMFLASCLTTSFFLVGFGSLIVLKNKSGQVGKKAVLVGLSAAVVLVPLQIAMGDLHGRQTRIYQPAKLAAMEALWETQDRAPLILFAVPNQAEQKNHFEIAIPALSSLIITGC